MIKSQTPPSNPPCDYDESYIDYDSRRAYASCGQPAITIHTNEDTINACLEHAPELRAYLATELEPF